MTALKRNKKSIIYKLIFTAMALILAVWSLIDGDWWFAAGMTGFLIIDMFDLHNLLKIRKGLKINNES